MLFEGPDCIFVGGLPYYFSDAHVRELLESFGPLRGFVMVKDRETGNSKGNAFCVYQDPFVTDVACTALNGIQMGDTNLIVRRANQDHIALQRLTLEQPEATGITTPTKVVYLTGLVTEEELVNHEDYEDILEDMKIECGKFGSLVNVVIPRPNLNGEPVAGVGKVFLEYADTESSTKAWAGLNGRNFGGNQVVASFYPEDKFNRGEYDGERVYGFDMAPLAYPNLAGAAAVSAGQVPIPYPAIPGMFQNMFPLATGQFGVHPVMPVQATTEQATRHARRVYFGLSPTANEQTVATFFSHVMSAIGGNTAGPGDAVVNVYINHEKKFAFVEMRSVEEASNAIALDGIIFEGARVRVRRPSDYNPVLAATLGPSQPNPNLNLAAVGLYPGSFEGPDCIFVGGLPYYFTEAQVRELLESFGALQGFDLVKDKETGISKGYAFCVYQDLCVTDIACVALNGIKMGDKTLTVRRANQGQIQPMPEQGSVHLHAQQQMASQGMMLQPMAIGTPPTKVLSLTQVVTEEDLINDEDYEDILEDMEIECGKFGSLVNVVIPRPNPNGEPVAGVGKVLLEYADTASSMKARAGLNGRRFGGNQVVASFYPENKFNQGEYDG